MFSASKWPKLNVQGINTASISAFKTQSRVHTSHTHTRTHTHTHTHPPKVSHTKVNSQAGPRCSNANWQSVRQSANTQGGGLHIWAVSQTTTRWNAHSERRINSSSRVMRLPATFHSRSRSNSKTISYTHTSTHTHRIPHSSFTFTLESIIQTVNATR